MIDVVVVLGDSVDSKKGNSEDQRKRVDQGILLFHTKKAKFLLFCGGFGRHFNTTKISLAKHMKQFAVEKGVLGRNILLENKSFNTIENLIFAQNILNTRKFKRILIVSSDWHIARVKLISRYVFRKGYSVTFSSVRVKKSDDPQVWKWEIKSRKRDTKIMMGLNDSKKP